MKRIYFIYVMQAVVLLCCSLVMNSCDRIFAAEDNPVTSYLSMNDKAVTLKVGETCTRTAFAASDAIIEYSSSDVAVATVDQNGVVTAVGAGMGGNGGNGIFTKGSGRTITINGGIVNATGSDGTSCESAIMTSTDGTGSVHIYDGHVTATANENNGIGISTGLLIIGQTSPTTTNPTVNATGYSSIGIKGNSIYFNNGKLIAIGGDAKSGTDANGGVGIDGFLSVRHGEVTATDGAKDGTGSDGLGVKGTAKITTAWSKGGGIKNDGCCL